MNEAAKLCAKKLVPTALSWSRIVAALLMFAFPPDTFVYLYLYLWCGLSDVLDGLFARVLGVVSERGALLDTRADMVFFLSVLVTVFPYLGLPHYIWIWIGAILLLKIAAAAIYGIKTQRHFSHHSLVNKVAGVSVFAFPFALFFGFVMPCSIIVCLIATLSAVEELYYASEAADENVLDTSNFQDNNK